MSNNRLVADFYELTVGQLMDRRVWDIPIVERDAELLTVLNVLGARNHIWVVNNKEDRILKGVITEHDVLSILAPKKYPSYVFGMPDIRSIQYGTAKTAGDIKCKRLVTCQCEDKILSVLEKMTRYSLRRLPVVDDGKLIGEITLHQLIRKYYDATQYIPITNEQFCAEKKTDEKVD